jgi:hypothetical protein
MKNLEKRIELSNEKACEILNYVEFKDSENEIKAIEELSSYILSEQQNKELIAEIDGLKNSIKFKDDYIQKLTHEAERLNDRIVDLNALIEFNKSKLPENN